MHTLDRLGLWINVCRRNALIYMWSVTPISTEIPHSCYWSSSSSRDQDGWIKLDQILEVSRRNTTILLIGVMEANAQGVDSANMRSPITYPHHPFPCIPTTQTPRRTFSDTIEHQGHTRSRTSHDPPLGRPFKWRVRIYLQRASHTNRNGKKIKWHRGNSQVILLLLC